LQKNTQGFETKAGPSKVGTKMVSELKSLRRLLVERDPGNRERGGPSIAAAAWVTGARATLEETLRRGYADCLCRPKSF